MDDAPIPQRRRRRIALALAGLALLAVLVLWTQRKPIATGFVDRALRARGVHGSYRIVALGVARQRLERIRIGDPAAPDLTADWAELSLAYGVHGPEVSAIRAHGVRLRGRLVGGRVSLGAVDRLLPKPSGAPFALPEMTVELADARMRLETPAGRIGLALDGHGNLADGFAGRLAAIAPRLVAGGCAAADLTAWVNIAIHDRKPALDGPVRVREASCGGARVAGAQLAIDATLNEALDRWNGGAAIAVAGVAQAGNRIGRIAGRIGFDGDTLGTRGELRITTGAARGAGLVARAAGFDGAYALGATGSPTLAGRITLAHATIDPARVTPVLRAFRAAAGSPVAPIAQALALATGQATSDFGLDGRLALALRGKAGALRLSQLAASSASGARFALGGGDGMSYYWPTGALRTDGVLTLAGGGFPEARIIVRQRQGGNPISGQARVAPYAGGGARLALAPLRFATAGGTTRFTTNVTLDGPLAGGRVTGLSLPLDGRFDARGTFVLDPHCVPLGMTSLALAGAQFGPARLTLCPDGGALAARTAGGPLHGGGRIAWPRLVGRSGTSPLVVAAESLQFALDRPGFALAALQVRLGAAGEQTRLDVAKLGGAVGRDGLAGTFAGAAGQIGKVPLLMSQGQGSWRLADGVLALDGGLRVADEAPVARFQPLVADDVRLKLAAGLISATATLREPASRAMVSRVTLRHDLSSGVGRAILDVPELRFGDSLQPEALTRLTLGVVANVSGAVSGRGEILWSPQRVTSTGRFRTDGLDLAAAFGPVSGIKTVLVFTDLLGLETAPGQVATIAEVNPGIVVAGGVVHYQLLAGQRVRIEGGRWPFSGGALILRPTIMDFGQPIDRNLSFEIAGLDAARFVQQLEFQNIAATGTFDGVVPMVFDAKGGRIVGGRLIARKGGGTLAYVGEITKAQLGVFGKLAFDALKSIRYQALSIDLDGALDGEIVSRVLFNGVNQQPLGSDTPFAKTLQRLPFKFNITIRAPFRGLVGSARSFADPSQLVRDALPSRPAAPAKTSSAPVQPQESEDRP